ncbi:hypothetical protein MM236_00900 [Belliella sp. DSM 107340]|uniref:Uncharacterized protein n=1 Tax=Belliella calami TaxID=2923436 RepID=A0ABS9UJW2_9BACT|nr:hypothetical protein [Belliella calami]MCH7396518.1 hypothetical protein [Belliella calami]
MKKIIKNLLSKNGIQILKGYPFEFNSTTDFRELKFKLNCPLEAWYRSKTDCFIVDVDLQNLLDLDFFEGFWKTAIDQYENGGFSKALESFKEYYSKCQFENVADRIGITPYKDWHFLSPWYYVEPWEAVSPESAFERNFNMMVNETKKYGFENYKIDFGHKSFGPLVDELVELELKRLVGIYNSIKKYGLIENSKLIKGKIFVANDQVKVRPGDGWHRVFGCLSNSFNRVPMKFNKLNSIVRREDVRYWPSVNAGLYSKNEALMVFDNLFSK